MAHYRKIDSRVWNDGKFMALGDDGKLIFLFLLTHPYLTMTGAMRATMGGLADELGWKPERFQEGFLECLNQGIIRFLPSGRLVWLPRFLRYNPLENPNQLVAAINALDLLPECNLKLEVIQSLKPFAERFGERLPEPLAKGSPNQEQEPEQEQEQEKEREGVLPAAPSAEPAPLPLEGVSPEPPTKRRRGPSAADVQWALDTWNTAAAGGGLVKATGMNPGRLAALRGRLKEAGWREAFQRAAAWLAGQDWATGRTVRGWRADLDFLLRPGNAQKWADQATAGPARGAYQGVHQRQAEHELATMQDAIEAFDQAPTLASSQPSLGVSA